MKQIKPILIILLSFIIFLSSLPINYLNVNADDNFAMIKDNIIVPNVITSKDGVYYTNENRSGELGNITIPVPERKRITSVQVLDSQGNYVKHLFDHTNNVYRIGTVPSEGNVSLNAETISPEGYFEWWQTSGDKSVWAFDLDGVRHFRKFEEVTNHPLSFGTYQNVRIGETPKTNSYKERGEKPSWYTGATPNHNLVFADEVPNKANVGWASRDITVTNTSFNQNGLNISLDKLRKVSAKVEYNTAISTRPGYIPSTNVLNKIVMNSSDDIIKNKNVKLWFSARMGSYGVSLTGDNGLLLKRYYNSWKITLSTTLYKYNKYKIVAYYEDIITNEAALTVDGDLNACLDVGATVQLKSTLLKANGFVWEFSIETAHPKLIYKSSNTKIVTVTDTGLVKIVGEGSATITTTYTEGDGSPPLVVNKPVTAKIRCNAPPIEIPDLPTVSNGFCLPPSEVPEPYEYELDFEVVSVINEKNTVGDYASPQVTVKRHDFSENRLIVQRIYNQYRDTLQKYIDDCNDLVTFWNIEKTELEESVALCLEAKNLAHQTNQTPVNCDPFTNNLNLVNDHLSKANNMLLIYADVQARFRSNQNQLTSSRLKESITTGLFISVNNVELQTLAVTLKEGEIKTITFDGFIVNDEIKEIYAQINTKTIRDKLINPSEEFAYTNLHDRIKVTKGYNTKLGHDLYPSVTSNNWKSLVPNNTIPTLPGISEGACGNPSVIPNSYEYELDLEVTRLDARTVIIGTETNTDVYVYRADFSSNRMYAEDNLILYKGEIELLKTDCQKLLEKWETEKEEIEGAKLLCEQASTNCTEFVSALEKINSLLQIASESMQEYVSLLNFINDELEKINTDHLKFKIVEPSVYIYLDGKVVSSIEVSLQEGEQKRIKMPVWIVPDAEQNIYAQINTNGVYEEFAYTDIITKTKQSRGYNTRLGNVLYPNARSNNWKDVIQFGAQPPDNLNACPIDTPYFESQSVEAVVRSINDNGNKRNIYERLDVSFSKLPRTKMKSGYGFEFQINTIYTNYDTEPEPTLATGTQQVNSFFPTIVKYQEYPETSLGYNVPMQIQLNGANREKDKTWILPPVAVEEYSGNVFTVNNNDYIIHPQRDHKDTLITIDNEGKALNRWYTNFNDPDGNYDFTVITTGAGVNQLTTCHIGTVLIEGAPIGDQNGKDSFIKRKITTENPFPNKEENGIGWNWKDHEEIITELNDWYNHSIISDPTKIEASDYEKTFYLTRDKIEEINEYIKEHPNIKFAEFVQDKLQIPSTR